MGMEGLDSYLFQEDQGYEAGSSSGEHSPDEAASFDFTNNILQDQLLQQAQALLWKSQAYQKIGAALQKVRFFQPNFQNLTSDCDEDFIGPMHRDAAVNNLRFLNIFYGFSPRTFALAVNYLDRLLGRVKVHSKYLSCITISCFYIAMKTQEEDVFIPRAKELVTISQCGCTVADLLRMEGCVLEKLEWQLQAVTPLTFLALFMEALAGYSPRIMRESEFTAAVAKLGVLTCHYEFSKFKAETVGLATLCYILEEMGLNSNSDILSSVCEMQYYCQIDNDELSECRGLINNYLVKYKSQPTKLPRLQLVWTISRRTLNKMKPSQRVESDLETIDEDEVLDTASSDDAGLFDSENENEKRPLSSVPVPTLNMIRTQSMTKTGELIGGYYDNPMDDGDEAYDAAWEQWEAGAEDENNNPTDPAAFKKQPGETDPDGATSHYSSSLTGDGNKQQEADPGGATCNSPAESAACKKQNGEAGQWGVIHSQADAVTSSATCSM